VTSRPVGRRPTPPGPCNSRARQGSADRHDQPFSARSRGAASPSTRSRAVLSRPTDCRPQRDAARPGSRARRAGHLETSPCFVRFLASDGGADVTGRRSSRRRHERPTTHHHDATRSTLRCPTITREASPPLELQGSSRRWRPSGASRDITSRTRTLEALDVDIARPGRISRQIVVEDEFGVGLKRQRNAENIKTRRYAGDPHREPP